MKFETVITRQVALCANKCKNNRPRMTLVDRAGLPREMRISRVLDLRNESHTGQDTLPPRERRRGGWNRGPRNFVGNKRNGVTLVHRVKESLDAASRENFRARYVHSESRNEDKPDLSLVTREKEERAKENIRRAERAARTLIIKSSWNNWSFGRGPINIFIYSNYLLAEPNIVMAQKYFCEIIQRIVKPTNLLAVRTKYFLSGQYLTRSTK